MIWLSLLKRSPLKPRRFRLRRGRIEDRKYLKWLASQGCLLSGRPATIHHVRRFGEPKNDHRTVPLAPEFHFWSAGPNSIERLGKRKFERLHGVSLETSIERYNALYFGALQRSADGSNGGGVAL